MKSTTLQAAFAMLLLVGAAPALAQRRGHPPLGQRGGFLLQTDADFGGETLATVDYEDDYSQDIRAGQGLALSIGGWFRPIESSSLELQASVGYKYETAFASNADISFSRTLFQLDALYRWPNGFFVGGGLMRHMGATLSGDDFFGDIDFDDANGFNVEAGTPRPLRRSTSPPAHRIRWRIANFAHVPASRRSPGSRDDRPRSIRSGATFRWRPVSSELRFLR
jgi:hypothetical protein